MVSKVYRVVGWKRLARRHWLPRAARYSGSVVGQPQLTPVVANKSKLHRLDN